MQLTQQISEPPARPTAARELPARPGAQVQPVGAQRAYRKPVLKRLGLLRSVTGSEPNLPGG